VVARTPKTEAADSPKLWYLCTGYDNPEDQVFVRYEILTAANINVGDYCLMGVTPCSLVDM
jgi:hypothetical protein